MKTTFNNSELSHVWAQQSQDNGKGSNMFFEKESIYSYGRHFEIARFVNGTVLFTTRSYSNSTAKHKSHVQRAINHLSVFTVPSFIDHSENVTFYLSAIENEILSATRARKHFEWNLKNAKELIGTMQSYVSTFDFKLSKLSKDLQNKYSGYIQNVDNLVSPEVLEKLKKREQERIQKLIRDNKEKIEKWVNGEQVSIYSLPEIFLRVKGNTLETSHGAEVPIHRAKRLYCLYKLGGTLHGLKIGYYTVLSLVNDTLKIGCHTIKMNEVERIAKSLNW